MPTYTYTGDEGRYYPSLGLAPEPGQEYELDRNPGDGRFDPPDPEPVPMTEAISGSEEITGDGSGEALPAYAPENPGPHTAGPAATPASRRTARKKEGSDA
jgi:hypothetical protein